MKKVESIWAELSAKAQESTELSEEVKVELSLIDDVQRISDTTVQLDNRFANVYSEFYKQWQKTVTLGRDLEESYREMNEYIEFYDEVERDVTRISEKVGQQARELGIDPMSIKGIKEMLKAYENMEDNANQAKQRLGDVERVIKVL
jgi:methyl-accepting chemotaxis protein